MSATNAKAKPKKGQHYLVGDGPSVRPGGVMVPPESKNAGADAQKEEDFSLMGAIASLSPWAVTPSAAAPPDEEGPADGAKPEDALVFFQQQTSSMDREALLARVAEAAAKEADAVTKLGQLTFKLAAKEKLMDDLRAGLVAAGRAVSEAQQEAEAVKKAVAQQEAALAGRYGTSVDVLKRLGEVTSKLEGRDSQIEALKAELASAKKASEDAGVQLAMVQKAARVKEAEAATAMAAAKKAAISREVELNAALAAAKSAAQKAMASAASARAERTADIIDVLSAKETQVEGLMTALDSLKVERDMMASEGVPEEDKEEVAEKDVLIRALLADLAKENGWRPAAEEVVGGASQQELKELRSKLEAAEKALGIIPMSSRLAAAGMSSGGGGGGGGYKASVADASAYNQSEIDALRAALDDRERQLGSAVAAVSRSPNPISAFSKQEVETLRAALTSREKELGLEPAYGYAGVSVSSVGGLASKELDQLRGEVTTPHARRTLASLEQELSSARATSVERARLISELQKELDEMLAAGTDSTKKDDAARSISARREQQLTAEVASLRDKVDNMKTSHGATLQSRDALIDGLKTDFSATRKRLAEAEKELSQLKRESSSREMEAQAEAAASQAAAEAARVAHAAQVAAKEAAIDALRADLAAARRAISSAEADIVSLKKQAASREAQLQAELAAAKRSYEVLKIAASAGGVTAASPADGPASDGKGGDAANAAALLRPSELTAQLAAREAQVESLRAELLAVRRAVTAAEEEAQSRRESAAALESELSAELTAAKAAHEAAELAAAELATNAASNAQNAAKMMSLLSEQLSQEREARRVLEAELRSAMEANPDMPRVEFPLTPLAPPKTGGPPGLGGLMKGIVAGVAAGLVTRVALPPGATPSGSKARPRVDGGVPASPKRT